MNPYFVPELKAQTGCDPGIVNYMLGFNETVEIIDRIEGMLEYLLPRFSREGKSYCTVGIGCTGGRHRSVMVSNELAERLERRGYRINLVHRDLHLE